MHHGRQQHRDRKRGRAAECVGVAWGVERRFAFGPSYEEQQEGIAPKPIPAALQEVFRVLLEGNIISPEEAKFIIHPLQSGDYFRVCADFDDYVRAQEEMQELWRDQTEWTRRSIETVAGMGKFSSDTAYGRDLCAQFVALQSTASTCGKCARWREPRRRSSGRAPSRDSTPSRRT